MDTITIMRVYSRSTSFFKIIEKIFGSLNLILYICIVRYKKIKDE
jgi:hypothetical protein